MSAASENNVFRGQLGSVVSARRAEDKHIVYVTFSDEVTARLTFLEDGIFRYTVDPSGEFASYAEPRDKAHVAKIQQYPDESGCYTKPEAGISDADGTLTITSGGVTVVFDKNTAKMQIKNRTHVVMEEAQALVIGEDETVQTLVKQAGENFYGGGTQNGRFVHTGCSIQIVNESAWMDGGVASPNPFYYTTNGYGVLRNTFSDGVYDFGEKDVSQVTAAHKEPRFDAYYFVSNGKNGRETAGAPESLLQSDRKPAASAGIRLLRGSFKLL